MFVSPAYAQGAGGAPGFDPSLIVVLGLMFVVMYFFMIRPQQKKVKEHRAMVAALKRGDQVVTSGGIIGTVARVRGDTELELEIAEGVRVRVVRATITEVLAKTGASGKSKADDAEEEAEDEAAESASAKK